MSTLDCTRTESGMVNGCRYVRNSQTRLIVFGASHAADFESKDYNSTAMMDINFIASNSYYTSLINVPRLACHNQCAK